MERSIFALRHARSLHNEWFITRLYTPKLWSTHDSGIIDAPLSTIGEIQAKELSPELKSHNFDLIICSPLTRALQTLHLSLPSHTQKTIITPLIKERTDRLSDTGKPLSTLKSLHPNYEFLHFDDKIWPSQENFKHESKEEFLLRIIRFKLFLSQIQANKILLVTHGNFIKTLSGSHLMVANCTLVKLDKSKLIFNS